MVCNGQESPQPDKYEAYNSILNYHPKFFTSAISDGLKTKLGNLQYDTLGSLQLIYGFQQHFEFLPSEIEELENEINQITVAFFMEGNPIKIKKVGGYDGCPDEMIYNEDFYGRDVTILNFCYTCSGANKYEIKFIGIVNNRTENLLKNKK